MNVFRTLIRALGGKRDLSEEMESHLRMAVADRVARGESANDARREVMREFGNVPLIADVTRERWGWTWIDDLLQDVRYGWRTLLKERSFTFFTVLTLALAIGACTAIFSLVNAVLLRSLPYGDAGRLVYLYTPSPHIKLPLEVFGPSVADFADLRRGNQSFESMTLFEQRTFDLIVGDQPRRVGAAAVDADFFHVLQVSPQLGRIFTEKELQPGGGGSAVVLSDALWHSVYGGRRDVLGSVLRLDGKPYQVIGVMPAGFGYPRKSEILYGNSSIETTQLWLPSIPVGPAKTNRDLSSGEAIARLKTGVTVEQAQTEMKAVMKRLSPLHTWSSDWTALVETFQGTVVRQARPLMLLLLGAVGFVLLIACGNAANLLLARAANRTHELGMRATLGARRGRLMRQMLTESLMLSGVAGIVGVGLAWAFLHALLRLDPGNIPRMQEASLDLRVLAFLVFVTMLTGILFGVLPSLSATRIHLTEFLKSGGMRGVAGDRRRLRSGLAVVQVALVVLLLTGTGLLLRSYAKVLSQQAGYSSSTITANIEPNRQYNTAQKQRNLVQVILEKIQAIHGVEAVGMIDHLPLTDSESVSTIFVKGYANEKNQMVEYRSITPGYLSAMQTPVLAGRSFTEDDLPTTRPAAVVNEAFAKRFFGGKDPIGLHVRHETQGAWSTVVGLIPDIRNEGIETPAEPQIYEPFFQKEDSEGIHDLAVRSSLPEGALVAAIRAAVHQIDPTLPVEDVHVMSELVSQASARRRFQTTLLTIFSAIAMFLAIVGIYGLLAYSVRQRTGEIGIRMALGSSKVGVMRLVLREGLSLLAVGLVIGLAGAFGCARLLTSFLYGVPAIDPVTFVVVPLLLLVATLAACLVPSVRAAAVDPMQSLRHE